MVRTENTRRLSHRARRQHATTQAVTHGWSHAGLPCSATIADRLRAKATLAGELGDRAADVLEAAGIQ